MNTQEVLALHTNRAVDLILGAVPEYQHPDEPCAEEAAADLPVELVCVDCGNRIEHDPYAESWLKCTVLYDPNACDIDNNGQWCPETDEEHRLAPDESECGHCGYIESRCICDELCFFRTYPGAPPCLEPKDEPSDEFCSECVREAARMDAMDGER